ncbi:ABC transporter permease [Cellulomonas cellasea]|uniref:ABC transporter permease n=1 Tax=Cellulomonas cellasea TaxID=43670 RepID=UPI0025A31CF1|nr:ABC transporter permease [Cellulomonas cellasea]MDM8083331.1 ABC transporter permease [Cellulomonas cellasea]
MFLTYLRRELRQRRKQTWLVALGLGLAIALVITVTSVTAGIGKAQDEVLASVYGVGTDITVTNAPQMPDGEGGGGPQQFEFEQGADNGSGGATFAQDRLEVARGSSTMDASAVDDVAAIDGVASVAGSLSLSSTSFSGEVPDMSSMPEPGERPEGGADGSGGQPGGGSFSIDSIDVEGIDLANDAVGPLTSATLDDGRALDESDSGANVALVDSAYATSNEIAVDGTVTLGGTDFTVVGIVSSTSSSATTAANVYIPLDTAQTLADQAGQVSTLYVQADSADVITAVQAAIETALPDATVATAADLASSVSGSLSSASDLAGTLGTWLAVVVLVAAFALAILFTLSGVGRRIREFGTLKALGWRSRRVVGQVMGESVAQGLLGGVVGLVLGLGAVLAINLIAPELSASLTASGGAGGGAPGAPEGGMGGGGMGGGMVGPMGQAASAIAVTLQAPVTGTAVLAAVALAVLGGLVAGGLGGWRAARLRPAEALRSVA